VKVKDILKHIMLHQQFSAFAPSGATRRRMCVYAKAKIPQNHKKGDGRAKPIKEDAMFYQQLYQNADFLPAPAMAPAVAMQRSPGACAGAWHMHGHR